MRIIVKIYTFFLFFLVASFFVVFTNHTFSGLRPDIGKHYGLFLKRINESVQCLIHGGIAYAQDSIVPGGSSSAGTLAHVASLRANRVKKRWLTFEEVRQYFTINPHNVSELRKKWPYAQIVHRADGTRLVWISQGVILPSSEKNTVELTRDEPDTAASQNLKATQKIEKQFARIAYAAPITLESSRNTDTIVKRDSCLRGMISDELQEKGMMHMVVWGESLSGIAQQYDVEWQDIYQRNREIIGDNPNLIEPGQLLHIPSLVYVVKKGDSLSKISQRVGISWHKIYDLNRSVIGDNPDCIEPGQKFTLSPHSSQTLIADSRQPSPGRTSDPVTCELLHDSQESEHTGNYPLFGNIESLWHRPIY
ncbi:MAG: LysM peptidoglycan-binding domain-containing protein [bacterium]